MEILSGSYIAVGLFKAVLNLGSMDTLQVYKHFQDTTKPRDFMQSEWGVCVCFKCMSEHFSGGRASIEVCDPIKC